MGSPDKSVSLYKAQGTSKASSLQFLLRNIGLFYLQNWDFADLWKTKMYKRKDIHNTYQCLRSWCIQQPVHVQAAYTRGSAGPRLRSPADTWAVMAVVKCGLFSARTLPWWRRTSWVWLTSKSLLINQHWKKYPDSTLQFPRIWVITRLPCSQSKISAGWSDQLMTAL